VKVLLDHNIPHVLRKHFPEDWGVYTAQHMGWDGFGDEQLLEAAVQEEFSVLVTLDSNLKYQRNIDQWEIGVLVLDIHPATPKRLEQKMGKVVDLLPDVAEANELVELSKA